MAGYLFSLDSQESLVNTIQRGVFATKFSAPNKVWRIHHEGTFADYCSMKEGDNVYFFLKRKIYGIGKLVNLNGDCKFLNYPGANIPALEDYESIKNYLLLDIGDSVSLNLRFICSFVPDPLFFKNGIDMDEILSSSPSDFRMLRAFWKLSFIKFPEQENQALRNIILRRNIKAIRSPSIANTYQIKSKLLHSTITEKIYRNEQYTLSIAPFLNTVSNNDGSIKHEMAIEAAIIFQLNIREKQAIDVFGEWDYLTHQVIASPLKLLITWTKWMFSDSVIL